MLVGLAVVQARAAAHAGSVAPLPPVESADGRLGLCDVLAGGPTSGSAWSTLAWNAGARINRWEFRWDRIEPQLNAWNFAADDAAVQSSIDGRLQVLGILIGTPGWAAASGQRPGNGVPAGLYRSPDDPRNRWAFYVRTVVSHYASDVRTWEIWNEPDLAYFWSGSPDDYFQLLKISYLVIKEANPSATVMLAGMVVPDIAFVTHVLDDARSDQKSGLYGGYLDAVAWHAYGNAQDTYGNVLRLRALLASRGFGTRRVWITEAGFPASNPNGEARQAAYVMQTIAYAFAAGASKVLVYRASDDALPKTWGLLTSDGLPRLGYISFQVAAQLFAHVSAVAYAPAAHVERFALYRGTQRVTLLWNRGVSTRTVAIPAAGAGAQLISGLDGSTSSVQSTNGQFTIPLAGADYNAGIDDSGKVVGGPAVALVEDNTASNFAATSVIPGLAGSGRRVVIVNGGSAGAVVQVSASSSPVEREVVHLPPLGVRVIDLDLLAGSRYAGSWSVRSSGSLAMRAVSDSTVAAPSIASARWLLPAGSSPVSIGNPLNQSVELVARQYRRDGSALPPHHLTMPALGTLSWTSASGTSTVLRATHPVLLSSPNAGVSGARSSWYAVGPDLGHVSLFNPSGTSAAADVRFIGSPTYTGQQVRVGGHRSIQFSAHGARAVVVTAASPVAVGLSTASSGAPLVSPEARTDSTFAFAGRPLRVFVLNPSDRPAHVSYLLLSRASTEQRQTVLAPAHVATLAPGGSGGSAGGLVLHSDEPVVAVPAS